jgi:prepilin-type N-terminal cleavage/methylation domain-containing protein
MMNPSYFIKKNHRGFTLPEVVFVIAIVAVITITVYTSFKTIISSYEKNSAVIWRLENARSALGDISDHLSNCSSLRSYSSLSVQTPVFSQELVTIESTLAYRGYSQDTLRLFAENTMVWYYLNPTTREFNRLIQGGQPEPIAFGVMSVSYVFFNPNGSSEWDFEWTNLNRLPRSVYIALTIQDDKQRMDPHVYTTMVTLND